MRCRYAPWARSSPKPNRSCCPQPHKVPRPSVTHGDLTHALSWPCPSIRPLPPRSWVGPDGRGFIDTYFVTSWAMTQADAVPNWSIGAGVVEQARPTGQPRTILCFSRKQVDSRLRVAPVMEPTTVGAHVYTCTYACLAVLCAVVPWFCRVGTGLPRKEVATRHGAVNKRGSGEG